MNNGGMREPGLWSERCLPRSCEQFTHKVTGLCFFYTANTKNYCEKSFNTSLLSLGDASQVATQNQPQTGPAANKTSPIAELKMGSYQNHIQYILVKFQKRCYRWKMHYNKWKITPSVFSVSIHTVFPKQSFHIGPVTFLGHYKQHFIRNKI